MTIEEKLRLFDEASGRHRKRSLRQTARTAEDRGWRREDLYERPHRYNEKVPRDAAELLKDALALSPEARAALADSLLASLDAEIDEQAENLWREEIRQRIEQIDQGAVELISWQDAQRHLRERLPR